jgi:hypothetical protein
MSAAGGTMHLTGGFQPSERAKEPAVSPVPVDPYPDFLPGQAARANEVDARFKKLYDALDKTILGLDATSIKDGVISTALLADGAVTAAKIPDASITNAKLATGVTASLPGARVTGAGAQSVPSGGTLIVAFNAEVYDTDNMHDNTTNNSRLTCRTAGVYLLSASVALNSGAQPATLTFMLNGSNFRISNHPAAMQFLNITTVQKLAVNDYVELSAAMASGSDNLLGAPAYSVPTFSAQYLSA